MSKWAGFVSAVALLFTVACGQTDAGITTAVKTKFAADDTVKVYQVDVDTNNKVVTLSGDVETMAQKEHAVTIARNTEGVTDVIDQMRVNPTAATSGLNNDVDVDVDVDDDLEASAKRGAEATKDSVEHGATATKNAVERGATATKNAAERGATATKNAAERGAEAVKDGAKRGAHEVKEGAQKAGAAVKDAVTDDDHDSDKDGK